MGSEHEIILYQTDETRVCVSVYYRDETFWMTQKALSELFDCGVDNISIHLKNIYDEKELSEEATVEFFSIVQQEGNRKVTRRVKCYNREISERRVIEFDFPVVTFLISDRIVL